MEIREALAQNLRAYRHRYANAVVRRDFALIETLWTPDGQWILKAPYDQVAEGRMAVVEVLRGLLGGLEFFIQMPHAGVVEVDGDSAKARWTMHEVGRVSADGPGHQNLGRYEDVLQRHEGRWLFVSRTYTWIYLDDTPLTGRFFPAKEVS